MRKKRKRRLHRRAPVNLRPILFVVLLVTIYLGITRSQLTDLRVIRVVGANPGDQLLINLEVAKFFGIPALQVNPNVLQNDLEMDSDIAKSTLSRNFFGRGVIKVVNFIPIARIASTNYGLSRSGVIFPLPEAQDEVLPTVRLSTAALKPHGAILEPYNLEFVAKTEVTLQRFWTKNEGILTLRDDGTLYLDRGVNGLVNFGGSNDFQEKITELERIVKENPSPLSHPTILTLVSPSHPVYEVYKSIEKRPLLKQTTQLGAKK